MQPTTLWALAHASSDSSQRRRDDTPQRQAAGLIPRWRRGDDTSRHGARWDMGWATEEEEEHEQRISDSRQRRNAVSYTYPEELVPSVRSRRTVSSEEVCGLLPRRVISSATSKSLASEVCAICLDSYASGDVVACMPCAGLHKGHWRCLEQWLQRAQTCPSCRYRLPATAASVEDVSALMRHGQTELERLRGQTLDG